MKRILAGLLLALLILSGCARGALTLIDTPSCTIAQDGDTISVCSAQTGEAHTITRRRVRGTAPILRTLVDSGAFLVQSRGGVLIVEDRAAGVTYVIR